MPDIQDTAVEAGRLLAAGAYYDALRCLNASTPHRFTALYKREDERAWNVLLYDKQSPYTPQFPEVAASETYCSMAIEGRQVIVVENSLTDPRLTDHAARTVVRSYCGAPLADASGRLFGTLCHFDFAPLATPAGVADLMAQLAQRVNDTGAMAALRDDVVRRLQNLAGTLTALACEVGPDEASAPLFDELAAPVRTLLARLPDDAQAAFDGELTALRIAFITECGREPERMQPAHGMDA